MFGLLLRPRLYCIQYEIHEWSAPDILKRRLDEFQELEVYKPEKEGTGREYRQRNTHIYYAL